MLKQIFQILTCAIFSVGVLSCGPTLSPDEAALIAKGRGRLIVPFRNQSQPTPSFSTKTIPDGTQSISVKLEAAPALLPEALQRIINTAEQTTVVFEDLKPGAYTLTGKAFNQLDAVGAELAQKLLNVTVQAGNNTVALGLEVNIQGIVKLTMLP